MRSILEYAFYFFEKQTLGDKMEQLFKNQKDLSFKSLEDGWKEALMPMV